MTDRPKVDPAKWVDDTVGPLNGAIGERLAEQLLELVAAQDGVESICDLGCGNGYLAGRLGSRGYRVVGVDASESYLDTARRMYASDRVTFRRALLGDSADALLDCAAAFDLVISSDVIEHLYRPADLVEAAGRILRPGGLLIVGTPYHGYLKNLALSIVGGWDAHHGVHWEGGHIKFFSVKTLSSLVAAHGFTVMQFHYFGRLPWLWKNMIYVARKAC